MLESVYDSKTKTRQEFMVLSFKSEIFMTIAQKSSPFNISFEYFDIISFMLIVC